jgi:hypothetical protein
MKDQMEQDDAIAGGLDFLSPAARAVLKLNSAAAYTQLVPQQRGSEEARLALAGLSAQNVLSVPVPSSRDDAAAVLSALWLWHDYLDESHTLSQKIESDTGSFWHAIMHRREGDFSNSKYWYARCEHHPALPTLARAAEDVTKSAPADKRIFKLTAHGWDPRAFVDLVQDVHNKPNDPHHAIAVALQQVEWRVLFDHCVRAAVE